jgi:signal transduction histidine kinase
MIKQAETKLSYRGASRSNLLAINYGRSNDGTTIFDEDIQSSFPSCALIVDDEQEICEEIASLLEDAGFTCNFALNADQAISILGADASISIVISDLKMPGLGGLEMISRLRQILPESRDLGVIIMTGHAGIKESIDALRLGAMEFLLKPVEATSLIAAVEKVSEVLGLRQLEKNFQDMLRQKVGEQTAESISLNTKLGESNRALEIANKAKTEFLMLISHELRTPLNSIIGFSEIMAMTNEEDSKQGNIEANSVVAAQGKKLLTIINTILELIDIENGDIRLFKTDVDVSDVINRVVAVYKPQAKKSIIKIIVENGMSLPIVIADQRCLVQAIGNVLSNAIQFSNKGGYITVAAAVSGPNITVTVSDCGRGMTKPEQLTAMEPFRQVDGSFSKEVYGLGLGLNISNLMTELHGGHMEIQSREGVGTVVTLSIPHSGRTT